MQQPSLSFKLGKNGKRNDLLINPEYMERNSFVICGLVTAVVKHQKDILGDNCDIYAYALETLHRTPAGRLAYIEARAHSEKIGENKFEVTLELNTGKKPHDLILPQSKSQRKAAKPKATKKAKGKDLRYGKFGFRMIPGEEPVKDNDAANTALAKDKEFTYAEFQALAAYENRTVGDLGLGEISEALGNCLEVNAGKMPVLFYLIDRKLEVKKRRKEILGQLAQQ